MFEGQEMFIKRVIPCLDVHEGRVVKGVNFENLKDAGDPVEIAAYYNQAGADELVLLDISATAEARSIMLDVVEKVAEKLTIPFIVGGGIRTVDDVRDLLKAGADKISINSAAIENPQLITECASRFGSQCVIVAVDAKKREDASGWDVYKDGGKVNTGMDIVQWAALIESQGAGEILLTSMDCDGTKNGYDIELLKAVTDTVRLPVIASGGAGQMEHFYDAIEEGKADAVLAASLFHFREIEIMELKKYLKERGIGVRMNENE